MEIDIFNIDKKIRDMWSKKQEDIINIDKEINELNFILYNDEEKTLSVHIQRDIKEKINNLNIVKNKIEEDIKNVHFYTIDFSEMIEKQKTQVPKKISFMGNKNVRNDKNENDVSKSFLDILKKYNIECKELEELVTKIKKKEKKICICGNQNFVIHFEQNIEICEECGKQEEKSYKSLSYKDISRINMSSKYTYERRIHFKDCMNQYQGKQNSSIDDKVFKDLELEFDRHGLLDKKDRFKNITKEHILLFLKDIGYSKHYEDIVLIYHKMTGKPVDDISYLENNLMEDFDKISNLYDKKYKFTGKIDRKSFINTQYILFQLLKRHKYPCKKEDFNMLKTLDRKSFHDDIVKDLFETLGFNFTPIF
jgi:hypothetical protein